MPSAPLVQNTACLILAGGKGSRLFPLTQTRCKPSVCFGGRYRLIDIPLASSLYAQIPHIFVFTQYLAPSLHAHIRHTYCRHPAQHSIHLLSSPDDKTFRGTADAIRKTCAQLKNIPVDYFLILSGDQLYNLDLQIQLPLWQRQDADLVLLSTPVRKSEATRLGLLQVDAKGHVTDFAEKPTDPRLLESYRMPQSNQPPLYLASMGIYLFKKEALLTLMASPGDDFGKDLLPLLVKQGRVATHIHRGYWEDIGTIESYYRANMALLSQEHCLNTHNATFPLLVPQPSLPHPFIRKTRITCSLIGQGTIIDAKEITGSIVGERVHIKENTIIRNSVLLGPSTHTGENPQCIGHNCYIENTILDEGAQIGNCVKLKNAKRLLTYDGNGIFIRDGIMIVPSGTRVPDGFTL